MFIRIINQLINGKDLSREQAQEAMQVIMTGGATEAQMGAFLTALRIKGETSEEIAGFAEIMRSFTVKVSCVSQGVIDTCGTGGDRKGTFNVSTTVAFVVAGAGVPVAKHGNHGISSKCGSADVLKQLGVELDLPPEAVGQAIDKFQVGFLYAPAFHPAMKYAGKTRRELGIRTVFNVLGPLTNPLGTQKQLMGVYEKDLTEKLADVLLRLEAKHAMVVHGLDGLDEISTTAPTQIAEVVAGKVHSYLLDPTEYGFHNDDKEHYTNGTAADSARIILEVLQGNLGACRDIVLLNGAAALVVADKAESIKEGIVLAARSIDSGAALNRLEELRAFSQQSKRDNDVD